MTGIEEVLSLVAADEGGVKDVGDGKGITRFGQTQGWLDQYGLPAPETPEQAISNWSVWLAKTKLDQIFLPVYDPASHVVVDFAVNSGSAVAIGALQSALRVPADRVIGPQTLAALAKADREDLAQEVMASRLEYQGAIITGKPEIYAQFAKGWAKRNARMLRRLR